MLIICIILPRKVRIILCFRDMEFNFIVSLTNNIGKCKKIEKNPTSSRIVSDLP